MAREDAEWARPLRSAADRKESRRWARKSADRAVVKLSEELERVRAQLIAWQQAAAAAWRDPALADRLAAVAPALSALLAGRTPTPVDQLRRNVTLHAKASGVITAATAKELRKLQHGARLGPSKHWI